MASIKSEYILEAGTKLNIEETVLSDLVNTAYLIAQNNKPEKSAPVEKETFIFRYEYAEEAWIINKFPTYANEEYTAVTTTPREYGILDFEKLLKLFSQFVMDSKPKKSPKVECMADLFEYAKKGKYKAKAKELGFAVQSAKPSYILEQTGKPIKFELGEDTQLEQLGVNTVKSMKKIANKLWNPGGLKVTAISVSAGGETTTVDRPDGI